MARGELILRHWNLLRMLQTRGEGMPLRDLAREFDVAERTIQRDFEVLQELGFPIHFEEDEFGKRFWRMPHDFFRTGPLVMGLTEAISLHLAERMLTPLAGTLFTEGIESVLQKVRSAVPRKALDYFAELDDILHVRRLGQTDYTAQAETINLLTTAAREEKTLEIDYKGLWRRSSYTTKYNPYGLVLFDGDLFLVGFSHQASDLRIFKVARIGGARATGDSFSRPEDFSLEAHFKTSFGIMRVDEQPTEVVVRFKGWAASIVEERKWHDSQQLTWLDSEATLFEESPDEPEALVATFQLADLVEFKRWIKGFGDQAEVLRPDSLRQQMYVELRTAADQYADS